MKKLSLLLLPLLSGAFVLQGADWVFEIPEGEFSYWVGVELLAVEEDFGDSAVSYPSFIPAKIAEAIANNINVRSLSGILKDKLVATSIGSKVYVDRKDKTATGYLGSVVGVIIEQWNKNGTPANLDDDVHVPLALLPESTFKGEEGEEGEGDPAGELEEGEGEEGEEDEGEEGGNRTPVVENVAAAQIEGTKPLRVTYDLEVSDDRPCTVTIRWSTNNGETFDTTAAAIVGDVGPGVEPGEKLEAIWDMGEGWNNKYTEEGRVEVIANRIGPEEEDHVVIEHPTGKWQVNDPLSRIFEVIADSPGDQSTMPAEDRKALEAAIETGSIRFVDVFYKDKDGVEHAFWFDGQHHSVVYGWYGPLRDSFIVSTMHGSPIGPSTDLLTLDAIHHLGEGEPPKVLLGDIPTSSSLRMEIIIAPSEHVE